MLTCIYHPTDPMRVVEEEKAHEMMETGFWFDCPKKALKYRNQVAEDMRRETQAESKKDKIWGPKNKKEGAEK